MVPDASGGADLGTAALEFNDAFFNDGAVINFGDDQDVTLTHVADAGLLLNSDNYITFRDSALKVYSSADGQLDIDADTEVEITATAIDINGTLDVSGVVDFNATVDMNTNDIDNAGSITFVAETDNGDSGAGNETIDWTVAQKQKSTLTGNCTYIFSAPAGPCNIMLKLIQDTQGSRTVTWPGSVIWPSGTAPTLSTAANKVDIMAFYFDGTNYYGLSSLDFS